jgi:outer membrane protein assembly factor BamB
MYQMDAQHTGRSPNRGPRWARVVSTFETSNYAVRDGTTSKPDIQSSAAVGSDGTIYIGNHQGVLFALRDAPPAGRDRGSVLELAWRFHPPEGSSWHATPALSQGGTVYLGFSRPGVRSDIQGTLYALRAPSDGSDADIVWSVSLGAGRLTSSPTIGPDGTIYVVDGSGWLYAVSPEGHVLWSCEAGPTLKGAPALSPDASTVYVSSMNGMLYALSPPKTGESSGKIRWTFGFADYPGITPHVNSAAPPAGANGIGSGASPTIAADGTLFIGANNSNFYALTPEGILQWMFEAEREIAGIWSTAALSDDESMLFFGANRGGMYAVNRPDGSLAWRRRIASSIYSSPALGADGVLYTGSTIGHVFALDSNTGGVIFDFDAGAPVWTAPAIRPDGSLVVADRNGRVTVIG